MPDNRKIRGGRDRRTISNQSWEVQHVAQKLGVSWQAVAGAKRATGSNDRKTVEAFIRQRKKEGAYS